MDGLLVKSLYNLWFVLGGLKEEEELLHLCCCFSSF